jgi:hypothetical protein
MIVVFRVRACVRACWKECKIKILRYRKKFYKLTPACHKPIGLASHASIKIVTAASILESVVWYGNCDCWVVYIFLTNNWYDWWMLKYYIKKRKELFIHKWHWNFEGSKVPCNAFSSFKHNRSSCLPWVDALACK